MRNLVTAAVRTAACSALLAVLLPSAAHAAATPDNYCVVHASQGGSVSCYATFTEAIADGTNGKVTDAPADARAALNDPAFAARLDAVAVKPEAGAGRAGTTAGGTVIGIEYMHIGYAFPAMVVERSHGCTTTTADVDWSLDLWGDWYWNDEISSFRTFANCWVSHFDGFGYTGARLPFQPSQYYIGDAMNDRTSSLQWS